MIDNDKKGKKIDNNNNDSPKPLPLKKMSPDIANISGRENCIHVNNDRLWSSRSFFKEFFKDISAIREK